MTDGSDRLNGIMLTVLKSHIQLGNIELIISIQSILLLLIGGFSFN